MWYTGRTRPRVGRLLAAALLAGAFAPATAAGHARSGISATDYVVTLDPLLATAASAVSAQVAPGDQSLSLTVEDDHTVVVLGYEGERFLRLGVGGVSVDESAPTALAAGLVERVPVSGPAWTTASDGRTVTWHDERVRRLAPGAEQATWTIPLLVDGEPVSLHGQVRRVAAPALGPWVALAGSFAALAALLLLLRRRAPLETAAVALAALSALAVIATAAGFAVASEASAGTWVESANEIVLAAVGLAVLAVGSTQARIAASALLGLLGITVALLDLGVLRHGVVLAAPPADAVRATVIVALGAGTAALLTAATVFVRTADQDGEALDSRGARAPARWSP
jgi:hypothetical protein